jgi:DNA-binding winged helix-turn-helix (wHTH) protein
MIYRFGRFSIDCDAREMCADDRAIELEPRAFDLLVYLLLHRERVVGKDELLDAIWPRQVVSDASLTRCVMKARKAVGDDAASQAVIRTLHGHGYRFVADVQDAGEKVYDAARLGVQVHAIAGEHWACTTNASAGLLPAELADLIPSTLATLTAK